MHANISRGHRQTSDILVAENYDFIESRYLQYVQIEAAKNYQEPWVVIIFVGGTQLWHQTSSEYIHPYTIVNYVIIPYTMSRGGTRINGWPHWPRWNVARIMAQAAFLSRHFGQSTLCQTAKRDSGRSGTLSVEEVEEEGNLTFACAILRGLHAKTRLME